MQNCGVFVVCSSYHIFVTKWLICFVERLRLRGMGGQARCENLSGSVFFQSRLSLLSESFSVPSTYVSHWLDHYVLNACIDLINSPQTT